MTQPRDEPLERVRVRYGDTGESDDLVPAAFAEQVLRFSRQDFDGAPEGPVLVEYVAADGRIAWRAYHRDYPGLVPLAVELLRQP